MSQSPANYSDGRPFSYSSRINDLSNAYVSIVYEKGNIIEPLSKFYNTIDRKGMSQAVVKSGDHRTLYILKIKDGEFAFRKRSFAKPFDINGQWTLDAPKRCMILATKGKVVFYWDSGEIKEFDSWQDDAIYNQREMTEVNV